jgi:hypothetical protein
MDGQVPPTNDQRRLNLLTPRERDVYEVWRKHPDWSNGQIGYAVYMPAGHVIRRYKQNIREKLGLPPEGHPTTD